MIPLDIIDEAWKQYRDYSSKPFIVKPSIPILFFGNYFKYIVSPLKVIAVGLNPSHIEFPSYSVFRRFPLAKSFSNDTIVNEKYIQTLSDYYKKDPYMRWFSCYEPILNGMKTSYFDKEENTALHTDFCSPLATNPTWSRLPDQEKILMAEAGNNLWHKLVSFLEPDVILISIARLNLSKIQFPIDPWKKIHTIEQVNPYYVESAKIKLPNGKDSRLIFGKASQTPFGTISEKDKYKIGQVIIGSDGK